MWCIPPKQNAEFVSHMEDVLEVYSREYNPKKPVICMDEKPFQLLDDHLDPIWMSEDNHIMKYDSEYIRKGSCSIFMFTHGLWLDIAEIELSALTIQCLQNVRIPSIDTLNDILSMWNINRNNMQKGVSWHFSNSQARIKLKHLYPEVKF